MGKNRGIEVVTFDCYGTLIDWETGIQAAFKQSLKDLALSASQESRVFDLYQEEEKRIEALRPYRSYRKVLSEEAQRIIGDKNWLHVAASLYHDIQPASKLGIKTVWVNRNNSIEGRKYLGRIAKGVENLTQLTDWLAP